MKRAIEEIISCDFCYGKGWLYYGNEDNYNVDPCECNLYSIDYETIMDYHQLFRTKENA